MKRVSKTCLGVLAVMLLLIILGGCGGQTAKDAAKKGAQGQKVVVRFSHGFPAEGYYIAEEIKTWANLAMQKSNGALEIQIYPAAQIYKDTEILEAIQTGSIESGHIFTYALEKIIPQMKILQIPFVFDSNTETIAKFLNSPQGKERFNAEMEKKGIKPIAWILYGQEEVGVTSNKEVKAPADAKGMTVRITSATQIPFFKKWGVNPSYLSGAEIYMALQRNVLQGAFGPLTGNIERKWYEVAPYHVILPLSVVESVICMNKNFFDKLPPELQKAILDAGKEVESQTMAVARAQMKKVFDEARAKGIKVYNPTPAELKLWTEDSEKLWQEVCKDNPQLLEDIKQVQKILKS